MNRQRREFLFLCGAASSWLMTGCDQAALSQSESQLVSNNADQWFMPDESAPHKRTWMAFGANQRIWGRKLLPEVRRNLATIANTIVEYEPVSMLVREQELELARSLISPKVELIIAEMDDLWMRDTGPAFVFSDNNKKAAVDFNFNGWGNKQAHKKDARVAGLVAQQAGVDTIHSNLVLEGGCFELDGEGTAIITVSCVLNSNRNPGVSKAQFEDEFMPLLGLEKIIWLPGIRGFDITDGHTDFYARFAKPGVVLAGYEPDTESHDHEITLEHLEILESASDAHGRSLVTKVLEAPSELRPAFANDDFAAGYIGYYVCNNAVIMQNFGDYHADAAAKETLTEVFPDRVIESIAIDGIAAGGGSVHCATQQEPAI